MYKAAQFDQNIPYVYRIMSIFTKIPWQAVMKLGKASPSFGIPVAGQCKNK